MADTEKETVVWKGNPSHVVFIRTYALCLLFCWLIVPVFYAFWKYLVVRNTVYEVTTERLRQRTGVLNKSTEDLELYRVKDFRVDQPLLYRLFSVGNVILMTSDRSHPTVYIVAIPEAEKLVDLLRNRVETLRRNLGVREVDRT